MRFQAISLLPLLGLCSALLQPNFTSSSGVNVYNPSDFFATTGPWSLMTHAGDTLYIAGPFHRHDHARARGLSVLTMFPM